MLHPSELALLLYSYSYSYYTNINLEELVCLHRCCSSCTELWIRQIILHSTRFKGGISDVVLLQLLKFGGNSSLSRMRFMILFDRDLISIDNKNFQTRDLSTIFSYYLFHNSNHDDLLQALFAVLKDERMCTIISETKLFHCDDIDANFFLRILQFWPVNNLSPFITDFVPIFIHSWILREFSAKFPHRVIELLHQKFYEWYTVYKTNTLKEKLNKFLSSCQFTRVPVRAV